MARWTTCGAAIGTHHVRAFAEAADRVVRDSVRDRSPSGIRVVADLRDRRVQRNTNGRTRTRRRERERYEFVATVCHELRTPLTLIRGYIETLLDEEVDVNTSRRFSETARAEAVRRATLVDGIVRAVRGV